jgi:hypothetical protein
LTGFLAKSLLYYRLALLLFFSTNRYLQDKLSKAKLQKAALRCRFVKLERDHNRLKLERQNASKEVGSGKKEETGIQLWKLKIMAFYQ